MALFDSLLNLGKEKDFGATLKQNQQQKSTPVPQASVGPVFQTLKPQNQSKEIKLPDTRTPMSVGKFVTKTAAQTLGGLAKAADSTVDSLVTDQNKYSSLFNFKLPKLNDIVVEKIKQTEFGKKNKEFIDYFSSVANKPVTTESVLRDSPFEKLKQYTQKINEAQVLKPSAEYENASLGELFSPKLIGETLFEIGPSIVSSIAPYLASPTAGFAATAGSVASDVKDDAIKHGMNEKLASSLGTATGAGVAFLGKFFPEKLFGNKEVATNFTKKFLTRLGNALLIEPASEVGEENLTLLAEATFRNDITVDELVKRNVMALFSGVVGAGGLTTLVDFSNAVRQKVVEQTPTPTQNKTSVFQNLNGQKLNPEEETTYYRGNAGKVDEAKRGDFGNVLVRKEGDQYEFTRELANEGDEEAKMMLENPGEYGYKQLDEHIQKVLKERGYDAIAYESKGEIRDVEGKSFSTNKGIAELYASSFKRDGNKSFSLDSQPSANNQSTFDDFIKKQGGIIYRGGENLSDEKITNSGISFSSNKKVAEDFSKEKGGVVSEYVISPDTKIVDFKDIPNVKFKNLNDYSAELDTGDKQIWKDLEIEYQKAVDWAKQNNFDAVKLPLEGEIRVINKDKIKSKQELQNDFDNNNQQIQGNFNEELEQKAKQSKTFDDFVQSLGGFVYHGTATEFDTFSKEFSGQNQQEDWGAGIYFTDTESVAESFAEDAGGDIVVKAVLDLKNPAKNKDLTDPEIQMALDDDMGFQDVGDILKEKGFDGVEFTHADGSKELVVYDEKQVKTEKQLRDIWDQANGKTKYSSPAQSSSRAFNLTVEEAQRELDKIFPKKDIAFLSKPELGVQNGRAVLGEYADSMIQVVESDGKVQDKTLYHEAFHAFFENYLSDTEQDDLNDYVIENHGDELGAEYAGKAQTYNSEEWLADNFADYISKKRTFTGKIKAFFDKLLAKINDWIGNRDVVSELFTRIESGKSKRLTIDKSLLTDKKKQHAFVDEYIKNSIDKKEPIVIDTDEFKKLNGGDYDPANHKYYSKMAYDAAFRAIDLSKDPNVTFSAGGPGSGKSEFVVKPLKQSGFRGVIIDGPLSDFQSNLNKIQYAVKEGKKVSIQAILPNIEDAWTFALNREAKTGRGVPVETFVDMHKRFVDTLTRLTRESENLDIDLRDVRGVTDIEQARRVEGINDKNQILDILEEIGYGKNTELIDNLTEYEKLYRNNRKSEQDIAATGQGSTAQTDSGTGPMEPGTPGSNVGVLPNDGANQIENRFKFKLDDAPLPDAEVEPDTGLAPSKKADLDFRRQKEAEKKLVSDLTKESEVIRAREMQLEFPNQEQEYGYQNFKRFAKRRPWLLDTATDDQVIKDRLSEQEPDLLFFSGADEESNDELLNKFRDRFKKEERLSKVAKQKTPFEQAEELKKQAEKVVRKKSKRGEVAKQPTIVRTEKSLLKTLLKREERGSKAGLREGVKQRQARIDDVVKFIQENLPKDIAGRYLKAVTEATTTRRVEELRARVLKKADDEMLRQARESLKETIDVTQNAKMTLDYRRQIKDVISSFNLATPTQATISRLRGLQDYIKANPEMASIIPQKRIDDLERLTNKNISEMTPADIADLVEQINHLKDLGELKYKLQVLSNERVFNQRLETLVESTENYDPGDLSKKDLDETTKLKVQAKAANLEIQFANRVADLSDGFKDYSGEHATFVKRAARAEDTATLEKQRRSQQMFEELQNLGIDQVPSEEDQVKIAINLYANEGAVDQAQTLMDKFGYDSIPELSDDQKAIMDTLVKAVGEKTKSLKVLWESTEKDDRGLAVEFGEVKNYFPIKYDEDIGGTSTEAVNRDFMRLGRIKFGSGEARQKNVKYTPRTDIFNIALESMGEQEYYLNMQPLLTQQRALFANKTYGEAAGKLLQTYWLDYIDTLARQGSAAQSWRTPIDGLLRKGRINLSKAVLGLKATSALIQPLAIFQAASYTMTHHGPAVTAKLFGNLLGTFANPNYAKRIVGESPSLQTRKGGEEILREISADQKIELENDQTKLNKLRDIVWRKPFTLLQSLDLKTAAAVQQTFKDELSKTMTDEEAAQEADFLMNLVSSTSNVAYRPKILSRGELARTFFTFQSFVLNEFGIVYQDIIKRGVIDGNAKQKLAALMGLGVVFLGHWFEEVLRSMLDKLIKGKETDVDNYVVTALKTMTGIIPVLGTFARSLEYNKAPVAPLTATLFEGLSGAKTIFTGKEDETKLKGAIKALETIFGVFLGVQGTAQAADIAERFVSEPKKKSGPKLDVPKLPKLKLKLKTPKLKLDL